MSVSNGDANASQPPLTWGALLRVGADYLAGRGVADADLNCEWLAARLLNCGRLALYSRRDDLVSERYRAAMRRGVRRLAAGEPLQYVLGEWDFRNLHLRLDARALIPRPETEQLVQQVIDCAPLWQGEPPRIADVGTGSGCIVISLACERPAATYLAFDTSASALELARLNAAAHQVADRIAFSLGELGGFPAPELHAVVSNPPYIRRAQLDALPRNVREHEPREALDGGIDGLDVIRRVARDAVMTLRPGGRLFLEIGETQGADVRRLLETLGFADVEIRRDAAGRTRFAQGWLA